MEMNTMEVAPLPFGHRSNVGDEQPRRPESGIVELGNYGPREREKRAWSTVCSPSMRE